jgi:hypothetical protein
MKYDNIDAIKINAGDVKFDIDTPGKINLITGDSSTGKSYLCSILKMLKQNKDNIIKSNINIDDIFIWDSVNDINLDKHNSIIIIDRYPVVKIDGLDDFINNSNNKFIVITHLMHIDLNVYPRDAFELIYDADSGTFKTESAFSIFRNKD